MSFKGIFFYLFYYVIGGLWTDIISRSLLSIIPVSVYLTDSSQVKITRQFTRVTQNVEFSPGFILFWLRFTSNTEAKGADSEEVRLRDWEGNR